MRTALLLLVFERILLPIAFSGEIDGAFGTRWRSEVLLFNDGTTAAEYCVHDCPINPRAFVNIQPERSAALPSLGAFLYVTQPENLRFTALLHDASRADDNAGTEMPVVRERDYAERIVLPRVPLRGDFRVTLRIYGEGELPQDVRVRMYRLDRLDPFVDTTVHLDGIVTASPSPYPSYPSFAIVPDLVRTYPVLEAAASARVEIDSLSAGRKIWAFASITNNHTQVVTTITPQ
jgi:hypothetical protein